MSWRPKVHESVPGAYVSASIVLSRPPRQNESVAGNGSKHITYSEHITYFRAVEENGSKHVHDVLVRARIYGQALGGAQTVENVHDVLVRARIYVLVQST